MFKKIQKLFKDFSTKEIEHIVLNLESSVENNSAESISFAGKNENEQKPAAKQEDSAQLTTFSYKMQTYQKMKLRKSNQSEPGESEIFP